MWRFGDGGAPRLLSLDKLARSTAVPVLGVGSEGYLSIFHFSLHICVIFRFISDSP